MGASLGELQLLLDETLGTTETRLYTDSMRTNAINRALKNVFNMYDLNEYIVSTTITFSSGIGTLPSDCMRPNLLVDPNTSQEYDLVDFESWLQKNFNSYKIQYDTTNSIYKMYIWPNTSTSLTFYYVQNPSLLVNTDDSIRLGYWWNEGIAEKAAAILLRQTRQYDVAQDKEQSAKTMLDRAYQNDRVSLQGRALQRLQSVYERESMYGNWSYFNNFSTTVTSPNLTWQTVTAASVQGLSNYGYFTNGTGTVNVLLPASVDINVGDYIAFAYQGSAFMVTQNAGQQIISGTNTTTVGVSGYIQSTTAGATITLVYRGSGVFEALSSIGTITFA